MCSFHKNLQLDIIVNRFGDGHQSEDSLQETPSWTQFELQQQRDMNSVSDSILSALLW